MTRLGVAVVGAGWAGLSAAVHLALRGHAVTVFEMARHCGGRARSGGPGALDNGQHILIGAYRHTLELMRHVGVDARHALFRQRLVLAMADGRRLAMPPGPAQLAFAAAVLRCQAWSPGDRVRLLRHAAGWLASGLGRDPDTSVDELCAGLPLPVRELLIDPLCVAALNTPSHMASAQTFLHVLRDGLFGDPGSSDLLLPRVPLQQVLPEPTRMWLERSGATWRPGHRVQALKRDGTQWLVDGERFDRVVLAATALESARLAAPHAPGWAATAAALRFEPIITVYLQHDGLQLPEPMLALAEDACSPAQFVFDRGRLDGCPGLFAFVVSGAAGWVQRGRGSCATATQQQAGRALARHGWQATRARLVDVVAEKRATFSSTPGLVRPATTVADGLWAAGDYTHGPYPATLEGAVRSGRAAAAAVDASRTAIIPRCRIGFRQHELP